jgi:hypothetical protein
MFQEEIFLSGELFFLSIGMIFLIGYIMDI